MLALSTTVRSLRELRGSCAHRGVALDLWNGADLKRGIIDTGVPLPALLFDLPSVLLRHDPKAIRKAIRISMPGANSTHAGLTASATAMYRTRLDDHCSETFQISR